MIIKTYEGFFDRFKGDYGFRIGKPDPKPYGERFENLLKIPVSDIQYVLMEITDEIKVYQDPEDPNSGFDRYRDYKFITSPKPKKCSAK